MSSWSKRLHLQSPVEKSCLHRQAILRASQATNKRFSSEEDAMLRASCQASLVLPAGCQAAKPLGTLSAWGQLRALPALGARPGSKGQGETECTSHLLCPAPSPAGLATLPAVPSRGKAELCPWLPPSSCSPSSAVPRGCLNQSSAASLLCKASAP